MFHSFAYMWLLLCVITCISRFSSLAICFSFISWIYMTIVYEICYRRWILSDCLYRMGKGDYHSVKCNHDKRKEDMRTKPNYLTLKNTIIIIRNLLTMRVIILLLVMMIYLEIVVVYVHDILKILKQNQNHLQENCVKDVVIV